MRTPDEMKSCHSKHDHPFVIAYFVTPHGLGHAARACAVMEALNKRRSGIKFLIVSSVKEWFFQASLSLPFDYACETIDLGLIQKNPLEEDIPATLAELGKIYPLQNKRIQRLTGICRRFGVNMVVCDISAIGISVGKNMKVPTVLVENFTWDWIYQKYATLDNRFGHFSTILSELYSQVDYRIQAEPICHSHDRALRTSPVSRSPRSSADAIRKRLNIVSERTMVLITMGGVPWNLNCLDELIQKSNFHFIVAGQDRTFNLADNVTLLSRQSDYYHPDLVRASDIVIGKLGYSTVAEVYNAGTSLGYIPREHFPETRVMITFVQQHLHSCRINEADFAAGLWTKCLAELASTKNRRCPPENGADQVACFIYSLIEK